MRKKNTIAQPAEWISANPLFPLSPQAIRILLARSETAETAGD